MASEFASLFSIATDRRVVIPHDFAFQTDLGTLGWLPTLQIVDPGLDAPLPSDAGDRIKNWILAVAGLSEEDQKIIGAASSAYHGALLLFDREPRAAYTLLITGLEVLSRKYGNPPTAWEAWEEADRWEAFFLEQTLSAEQAEAFRARLLSDKHLRLGLTFRTYGAMRPNDSFWERTIEQWHVGIHAPTGGWVAQKLSRRLTVADFVARDREALKRRLRDSYQLRSSIVHESLFRSPMAIGQGVPEVGNAELPFCILRCLLSEIIWKEISERKQDVSAPDFVYWSEEKSQ